MLIIHGERAYGKVERVPGLLYVSTIFFHAQFLPIAPLRTYIIIEGSEKGTAFRGKQVPLRWKSVAAGYLRGWLGAAAIIILPIAAFQLGKHILGERDPWADFVTFVLAAAVGFAVWYILTAKTWAFLFLQVALHGASLSAWLAVSWGIVHFVLRQGPRADEGVWETLVIGNVVLLVYTLTRGWSYTNRTNALELADRLALDREAIMPLIDQLYGPGFDVPANQIANR